MMRQLIRYFAPTCIIETGSFRGLTTEWFGREFAGPIFSCELSPRYYFQAVKNNESNDNISIVQTDSRLFLAEVGQDDGLSAAPLIYLDAHWEQDLPLQEELEIVHRRFTKFVVVIDDFEVPFDGGYTWDDYGEGKALNLNYISRSEIADCIIGFPIMPSDEENGARRGACVVVKGPSEFLDKCTSLKVGALHEWQSGLSDSEAKRGSLWSVRPDAASAHVEHRSGALQLSYPEQLADLLRSLDTSQAQAREKEMVIHDLKRECDNRAALIARLNGVVEHMRAEHAAQSDAIQNLKTVCDERLEVINRLNGYLNKDTESG